MFGRHYVVLVTLATLLVVPSCNRPKPAPRLPDRVIAEIRNGLPGITSDCLEKVRYGGIEAFPDRVDKCFAMLPSQRWRGLWRDNFEAQRFCPSPARLCSRRTGGDEIWLTFARTKRATAGVPSGRLYKVNFIGRRTRVRGHHGHLGMFQHEVLVDKLLSISPVD